MNIVDKRPVSPGSVPFGELPVGALFRPISANVNLCMKLASWNQIHGKPPVLGPYNINAVCVTFPYDLRAFNEATKVVPVEHELRIISDQEWRVLNDEK